MRKALEDFSRFVRRWLPAGIWMVIILAASTEWGSSGHSFLLLKPILLWLDPKMPMKEVYEINLFFRKTLHVVQFAILTILIWKTRRPLRHVPQHSDWRLAGTAILIGMVFSISSETIQLLFPDSRGASVSDVFLDTGGALLGLILIWFLRPRKSKIPAKKEPARILITADVHLNIEANRGFPPLAQLQLALNRTKPDACVIAGDFGSAENAPEWLRQLNEATGDIPLIVCLGNHEHWLPPELWEQYPSPDSIREKIWKPALQAAGIACLDFENVEVKDVVLVGGYGHFDLGMKEETLIADGRTADMEDYLAGKFAGMSWKDMQNIPHAAETLQSEAEDQAKGIETRLVQAFATGKQMVVVTHTVPFPELIGHPHRPGSVKRFFNAYSGNTLVGSVLAAAGNIQLAVCGHTHTHVPQKKVRGVPCVNIGSDYGLLRFVLYDSESRAASEIAPLDA